MRARSANEPQGHGQIIMRKLIILMMLFCVNAASYNAYSQQEIRDAGTPIKCREVLIPDPYGKLNQAGVWSRTIVVKVELLKKGTGEMFTKKTVIGYLSASTGSKLNEFNNQDLLFYQRMYGGVFPEYEYYNK